MGEDPILTETRDLAGEQPEKLAELQQAWEDAAWANQVYPLDEGNAVKMIGRRIRRRKSRMTSAPAGLV